MTLQPHTLKVAPLCMIAILGCGVRDEMSAEDLEAVLEEIARERSTPSIEVLQGLTWNGAEQVSHAWSALDTPGTTLAGSVAAVAGISSFAGADPADARMRFSSGQLEVSAQEEQSADLEVAHANERIDVLISTAPVLRDQNGQIVGRSGRFNHTQTRRNQWRRVTFAAPLEDPVVFAQVMTANDPDPANIRVRNVTDTGFDMRVDEWNYQDGVHGTETVGWIAAEKGDYTVFQGCFSPPRGVATVPTCYRLSLEVDVIDTNHDPEPYEPGLLVAQQTQTRNGGATVSVRVSEDGVFVQEEEGADGLHAIEEVGFARLSSTITP